MKRNVFTTVASMLLVAASAQSSVAQKTSLQRFGVGYNDLGPTVGVGGIGGASASFGARFEHAIKPLPDLGNGTLGFQVAFDYYSWSAGSAGFNYSTRYIPIGATANYHFKIEGNGQLDPFVGLGLGYNVVTCSYSGTFTGSGSCGYSSGIYAIGRAGARYFFSPTMAAYGDLGAGGATINLGVMFKM
jgi:hypothetical protein